MDKPTILYVENEVFLAKIVKEDPEGRGYLVRLITQGRAVLPAFVEYQPGICMFHKKP